MNETKNNDFAKLHKKKSLFTKTSTAVMCATLFIPWFHFFNFITESGYSVLLVAALKGDFTHIMLP